MKFKRPIFVISGTVIGTVGVLSYTPAAQTKGSLLSLPANALGATATNQSAPTTATPSSQNTPTNQSTQTPASNSPSPTPTKTAAKAPAKATKKAKAKSSSQTSTSSQTTAQTPAATQTSTPTPTPTKTSASTATRTIDGSTIQTPFGPVQVQITVQGTKIINAAALQTPQGGRSSWINQQAVPYLIQETLAAQSANIQGVGGATYTSQSWAMSLQAALAKM